MLCLQFRPEACQPQESWRASERASERSLPICEDKWQHSCSSCQCRRYLYAEGGERCCISLSHESLSARPSIVSAIWLRTRMSSALAPIALALLCIIATVDAASGLGQCRCRHRNRRQPYREGAKPPKFQILRLRLPSLHHPGTHTPGTSFLKCQSLFSSQRILILPAHPRGLETHMESNFFNPFNNK